MTEVEITIYKVFDFTTATEESRKIYISIFITLINNKDTYVIER